MTCRVISLTEKIQQVTTTYMPYTNKIMRLLVTLDPLILLSAVLN